MDSSIFLVVEQYCQSPRGKLMTEAVALGWGKVYRHKGVLQDIGAAQILHQQCLYGKESDRVDTLLGTSQGRPTN